MSTSGPSARGASTKHYGRDEISDGLAHLAATDHPARDEEGSTKCVPQFIHEQVTRTRRNSHFVPATVSARSGNDSGIVKPSALAVLRLTTSLNVVGCSTGISAGLVPRRILSSNSAARWNRAGTFSP